jgi:hypothetical protein
MNHPRCQHRAGSPNGWPSATAPPSGLTGSSGAPISGAVPKIPLNLVLLKGCRVLGFQFRSFAANEPEHARRDEAELLALLAAGRALPHAPPSR